MPVVQLMSSSSSSLGNTAASPPEALLTSTNTTASLIVTPTSGSRTVRLQQYLAGAWVDVLGGKVAVNYATSTLAKSVLSTISSTAGAVRAVSESGSGGVTVSIEVGYGTGDPEDPYSADDEALWTSLGGSVPETEAEAIDMLLDIVSELSADGSVGTALLAGRAGGQSLHGGTGPGEDLTLAGSTDADAGSIICDTWLYAQNGFTAGDLDLRKPGKGQPEAWWRIAEKPGHVQVENMLTGQKWEMALRSAEVGPIRRMWRAVMSRLPKWF